jgi:hypothetical protein
MRRQPQPGGAENRHERKSKPKQPGSAHCFVSRNNASVRLLNGPYHGINPGLAKDEQTATDSASPTDRSVGHENLLFPSYLCTGSPYNAFFIWKAEFTALVKSVHMALFKPK